jgi:O-methyltransferase
MTNWLDVAVKRIGNSLPVLRLMRRFDGFAENRLSERGILSQAFELVRLNGISGDYFEFGLFRGRTFLHARRMSKLYGMKNMHLWGFDSFQGLPQTKPSEDEIWSTGQFACSDVELKAILSANGVRDTEFTLVPGFYDQSLNDAQHAAMAGRTAAIIYIDCDLYESTVQVLRFIERYLVNGTVVCFDDFWCYAGRPDQGEQRALREFLDIHPNLEFQRYLTYCPVGQSFIVYRKS